MKSEGVRASAQGTCVACVAPPFVAAPDRTGRVWPLTYWDNDYIKHFWIFSGFIPDDEEQHGRTFAAPTQGKHFLCTLRWNDCAASQKWHFQMPPHKFTRSIQVGWRCFNAKMNQKELVVWPRAFVGRSHLDCTIPPRGVCAFSVYLDDVVPTWTYRELYLTVSGAEWCSLSLGIFCRFPLLLIAPW